MKQSPIRLLDEITAPFDSQSASQVLQSIDATSRGITSLMITHKLTEAQYADKIIVISKGRAIAEGRHEDLLNTCDLYQKLWSAYNTQESPHQRTIVPLSAALDDCVEDNGAGVGGGLSQRH